MARPNDPDCTCPKLGDAEYIFAETHTCPFKVEIHDDRETLCSCCNHCTSECGMSV